MRAISQPLNRRPDLPAAASAQPASRAPVIGRWLLLVVIAAWVVGMAAGFETALIILTAAGFLAAIIGLRVPAAGLIGISMLSALDAITRDLLADNGLLPWNTLNYFLLLVIVLSLPFILRLNDPHSRMLQIFIVVLTVGVVYSIDPVTGIQDVFNVLATFGLIVVFARAIHDDEALLWMGIVVGVMGVGGGVVFYLQMADLPYVNPNGFAFYPLTAMFAIALALIRTGGGRARTLLLALAGINMVWIFLSGSRGNMATGLFTLLFILTRLKRFSTSALTLIALALIGIWVSTFFVTQQAYVLHRLQRTFDPSVSVNQRTSGRSNIAAAGIEVFKKNPLGVGTGSFRYEAANQQVLIGRERPAHSAWIKTLAENGIPGIIVLAMFVGSFAVVGWQRRGEPGMLATGILVTVAMAIGFLSKELQGKGYWFLAAGGAVLLHAPLMLEWLKRRYRSRRRPARVYRVIDRRNGHHDEPIP